MTKIHASVWSAVSKNTWTGLQIRDRTTKTCLLATINHKAISKDTVARWLKQELKLAGIDTMLRLVRTVTTSGQYSPVRPSRSVSKRLLVLVRPGFEPTTSRTVVRYSTNFIIFNQLYQPTDWQ